MADPSIQINPSLISWILGSLGSLVLFFLGLGAKDIRDKMKKVDEQCLLILKLKGDLAEISAEQKGELSATVAELKGEIRTIHQRLYELERLR